MNDFDANDDACENVPRWRSAGAAAFEYSSGCWEISSSGPNCCSSPTRAVPTGHDCGDCGPLAHQRRRKVGFDCSTAKILSNVTGLTTAFSLKLWFDAAPEVKVLASRAPRAAKRFQRQIRARTVRAERIEIASSVCSTSCEDRWNCAGGGCVLMGWLPVRVRRSFGRLYASTALASVRPDGFRRRVCHRSLQCSNRRYRCGTARAPDLPVDDVTDSGCFAQTEQTRLYPHTIDARLKRGVLPYHRGRKGVFDDVPPAVWSTRRAADVLRRKLDGEHFCGRGRLSLALRRFWQVREQPV